MTEQLPDAVRRPRSDGSAVFDAILAPTGYFALPIAHQRGLFRLLEGKRLTLGAICEALELKPRPANALLAAAASLGLLELSDDRYALTPLAEDYLLESSPTYMGFFLDLSLVGDHSISSFDRAVGSDSSQRPDQDFASFEEHAEQARGFTRGMHSVSVASALVWPQLVDLAGDRLLLDVGGGSGAHSIGACLRWPKLHAIVLDLPPVCDVADEFIARHSLEGRITTRQADMWADPFPPADVHFYSNILHDWPPEKGQLLIEKSYQTLEPGGRILLHEALFDDDKTGPFRIAAFNMSILWAAGGQQYSGRELSTMLADTGFQETQVIPTPGYYSIIAARKP
jgi:hypothetical protein